jgi:hypothetical protein
MIGIYEWVKDVGGPLVSTAAALLSIYFFIRTNRLSGRMADRSIYVDVQKFLIEICQQLIAEPLLWCIYDDRIQEDDRIELGKGSLKRKLEAFAHLHLNMFEIVLAEAPNPLGGNNENQSNVWISYFHDTLQRCSLIREVLEEPASSKIWNRVLLEQYGDWKRSVPSASSGQITC